jgi:hypothetical protein
MREHVNSEAPASGEAFLDEKQQKTNFCPKDGGLWDIPELMRHVPLCRRSISNLRKRGLPTIVLGRRVFFHPGSIEAWLMRKQRGGGQ